mmetsp:Transcript_27413/g.64238  ORF Transcript_27413/g.64238 Transcript_27413/m.64238 type:complete len:304 (+) Transcript_27413:355-1266(+)
MPSRSRWYPGGAGRKTAFLAVTDIADIDITQMITAGATIGGLQSFPARRIRRGHTTVHDASRGGFGAALEGSKRGGRTLQFFRGDHRLAIGPDQVFDLAVYRFLILAHQVPRKFVVPHHDPKGFTAEDVSEFRRQSRLGDHIESLLIVFLFDNAPDFDVARVVKRVATAFENNVVRVWVFHDVVQMAGVFCFFDDFSRLEPLAHVVGLDLATICDRQSLHWDSERTECVEAFHRRSSVDSDAPPRRGSEQKATHYELFCVGHARVKAHNAKWTDISKTPRKQLFGLQKLGRREPRYEDDPLAL